MSGQDHDFASMSDILDAADGHIASDDHAAARRQFVVEKALGVLEGLWRQDPNAAEWAAYSWQEAHKAEMPYVAIVTENTRESARFWAETASPSELECYLFASVDRLRNGLFATRQVKRMIGGLWRRMSPTEKEEFLMWAKSFEEKQ